MSHRLHTKRLGLSLTWILVAAVSCTDMCHRDWYERVTRYCGHLGESPEQLQLALGPADYVMSISELVKSVPDVGDPTSGDDQTKNSIRSYLLSRLAFPYGPSGSAVKTLDELHEVMRSRSGAWYLKEPYSDYEVYLYDESLRGGKPCGEPRKYVLVGYSFYQGKLVECYLMSFTKGFSEERRKIGAHSPVDGSPDVGR